MTCQSHHDTPPRSQPAWATWSSAERCEEVLEATRADEEPLGDALIEFIDEELLGGRDYILRAPD